MKNDIKTIGLIGYGRFGSFFARDILPKVFPRAKIEIFSRTKKGREFKDLETVCKSDLVIPTVPIGKTEKICKKISGLLSKNSIVMDVCSVKSEPARWMKAHLPKSTDIISSHPMFGQSSYNKFSGDLSKLKFVIYPTRCSDESYKLIKESFAKKLEVIEMDPETHDKLSAKFQFTAHFFGQALNKMNLSRSHIDTESAKLMIDMMENLSADSDELFLDMYRFNPYAKVQLANILLSISAVTNKLK